MMTDSTFIKATKCKKTNRPPVWLMRQAGRYLPEYREIRGKNTFQSMIRNPELATEITLQPIHRFGMDAAILFSDILVTAEALGNNLDYIEKRGPVFENPLRSIKEIENQDTGHIPEKLSYVTDAIKRLLPECKSLNTPLIGFAGAPFTVASYLVEGESSKELKRVKQLMYQEPDTFKLLMDKLCVATIDYLNAQIEAGIDALQIFDTWAGLLTWNDFKTYSFSYIETIIKGLKNPENIPISVYCRGSSIFANDLQHVGANVISLDWQGNLKEIKNALNPNIAIQGNLDPFLLYAPPALLEKRVHQILSIMKDRPGFIFNLGHGVLPDVDPNQIKLVVETVKAFQNTPAMV
jgi:uroporphyrinogen decarboxylase